MATELQVVNGPSKWDLMIALFDDGASFHHSQRLVEFRLEDSRYIRAMIVGVFRNYDSDLWVVEGIQESNGLRFRCCYSPQSRHGEIKYHD